MSNELNKEFSELNQLIAEQKEAEERVRDKQKELGKFSSVSIGDIVTVNAWSHKGKTIKVSSLRAKRYFHNLFEIIASGSVIKKDGTEGVQTGEFIETVKLIDGVWTKVS